MYRAVDQSRNMDSLHRTCVIGFQYMTQHKRMRPYSL